MFLKKFIKKIFDKTIFIEIVYIEIIFIGEILFVVFAHGPVFKRPKECRFLRELPDCRSFKNKTVFERPILLDEWHDDPCPIKVFGKDILRLLLDKPSLGIIYFRVICLIKIKSDYCMKLFVESIFVERNGNYAN